MMPSSVRAKILPSLFRHLFLHHPTQLLPSSLRSHPESTMPLAPRPILKFKRLSESACKPMKASATAAGFDLSSAENCTVPSHGKKLVKTDLQIEIPEGCYGRIAPRSGLAHKNFIDVGAGVIDSDYRGNVGVILFNFSDQDFVVKQGDRIAQLICEKIEYPELQEEQELTESGRGDGGFGSTGIKGTPV